MPEVISPASLAHLSASERQSFCDSGPVKAVRTFVQAAYANIVSRVFPTSSSTCRLTATYDVGAGEQHLLSHVMPEDGTWPTFMAAGSSDRNWKPAMLRREKIRATSCSENLHAQHNL